MPPAPIALADPAIPTMDAAQALAFTNALAVLTTALQTLTDSQAAAAATTAAAAAAPHGGPLLDPFQTNDPFDLSSRAGSVAYATACSALTKIWDGTPDKLPSFIVAIRICAAAVNWNAPAPHGILTYATHNLLTDHHSIAMATLEAARIVRVNPRARQNSKAFYECLKKSIATDVLATLFEQADNLLTEADGPTFFAKMLSFTTVSSLQLSMMAFDQIM